MFRSFICEARLWPVVWRRRFAVYWLTSRRDPLGFFAMFGVPIAALAFIVCFAYTEQTRIIEPVAVDVAYRRARDLRCLAENVYFEARGEPLNGQYAVAEVTLNRLRSPLFPKTICKVVHEMRWDPLRRRLVAHFSWTEQPMRSEPMGPAWQQALAVATAVYDDMHMPIVPGALFYHSTRIRPDWARTKRVVAKIGNHIFYR